MDKIRKGDDVVVIAGRDKGRRGVVLANHGDGYLVVEGVNKVKKHVRPNPMKGVAGGIIDKEMPIHISNVAMFNQSSQKKDRIGFGKLEDGGKVRVFRSTGEQVGV